MHQLSRSPFRFGLYSLSVILMIVVSANFQDANAQRRGGSRRPAPVYIPRDTELKIRLEDKIDSKESKDGDTFRATVLSPRKYADATIEGHVSRVEQSGKIKGSTQISLSFDRIRLTNGASGRMAAQVVKVYGEDSVKEVDEEGNVKSGSQGKDTAIRSGGAAAAGAIIGAIAGGGKGAAIGAAVGAGAGAGSVLITGSKKLTLDPGTEILIRSTR
ncbi:MAG TPA: hypothetical protein VJ302_01610 [Blastocatellia bacterium]|nr:hypothetical protein [Blastocatellia bacterium]